MLVGKDGSYTKPTHPCVVVGCEALAFQESKGACKTHMFEKMTWLKDRVLGGPAPLSPSRTTG